ncbi:chaperonin 10-like protein [Collybia nuda]|uniref:Chaperonin 10-like protein n=1 Tax=Collybia nuda TaxID=64659 RepID=A0A9P5Y9U9_9AGAR|nr:chaperonin 10-like protein [Collybia nuda]
MAVNRQKALVLDSKFGKFVVGDREILKPGPGELLVKVLAAALNPVDWKIQKYGIFIEEYPAVLGTDVAGDVAEVGEGVNNFSPGDRVFFQGTFENKGAGFQQFTIATAATTAKIPKGLSYEEASTIPLGLTTAYLGFYNSVPYGIGLANPLESSGRGIFSGKPVVILGGSSSVGQFALQLAKLSGFSPIITTSSPKHTAFLESLGATHVIDRHTTSVQEDIEKITTAPIEYIYDAISAVETQQIGYDLLAPTGRMVTDLAPAFKAGTIVKSVTPVLAIQNLPQNRKMLETLYSHLTKAVTDGIIKANRHQVLSGGLGGIVKGLQLMENDQVSGVKLVGLPWQD